MQCHKEAATPGKSRVLSCTPTLSHRVKLGCNKEFAKYQKRLHIRQKHGEGIGTTGSVLFYTTCWRLGTQKEDERIRKVVDHMAGATFRILGSMI